VIISDEDIDYPKDNHIDLLLALTQESCDKYYKDLKDGGILLVDSEYVTQLPRGNFRNYKVPISEIARSQVGKVLVANIVAMGIITELSGVVSREAVESAILSRVPKGTEELNLKAFRVGLEKGKALKEKD